MARPLPPLNALRAFEATARRLSFTEAARELHVTPAALSHQIRGLEERLGLALFHRHTRAIELTEEGRLIYPGIHAAFEGLRETIQRLDRVAQSNVLVVSATPGFTVKWLVPRLYRFLEAHPEIDVRIAASMQKATFEGDGIDVAIRFILGTLPDHHAEKLADDTVLPLCSPRLLDGERSLREPRDLARHTLIHIDLPSPFPPMPTWEDWLAEVGVEGVDALRGPRFNTVDHAIDAAVEGVGVALAQKIIALGDLQAGRLVVPFGPELPIRARGYHFVCPRGRMAQPKVRAFRDWLFAEIAKAAADLGQDFLADRTR
ncbi:MAG TPA: transcriptional regulator GcvA [Microvirga sp.]|jgi:LysR family glycine cleavage system transcriptional activator|nr:transcriptional regulator GcvA [Microvirga sp.]